MSDPEDENNDETFGSALDDDMSAMAAKAQDFEKLRGKASGKALGEALDDGELEDFDSFNAATFGGLTEGDEGKSDSFHDDMMKHYDIRALSKDELRTTNLDTINTDDVQPGDSEDFSSSMAAALKALEDDEEDITFTGRATTTPAKAKSGPAPSDSAWAIPSSSGKKDTVPKMSPTAFPSFSPSTDSYAQAFRTGPAAQTTPAKKQEGFYVNNKTGTGQSGQVSGNTAGQQQGAGGSALSSLLKQAATNNEPAPVPVPTKKGVMSLADLESKLRKTPAKEQPAQQQPQQTHPKATASVTAPQVENVSSPKLTATPANTPASPGSVLGNTTGTPNNFDNTATPTRKGSMEGMQHHPQSQHQGQHQGHNHGHGGHVSVMPQGPHGPVFFMPNPNMNMMQHPGQPMQMRPGMPMPPMMMPQQGQPQQQQGQQGQQLGLTAPGSPLTAAMLGQPDDPNRRNSWFIPLPKAKFEDMSKQEMALVIRMQLNQLQNSDPFQDDFYYQVWSAKRGQADPQAPSFLLPYQPMAHVMTEYRNPDGSPKLPEGTLGRIATTSLKKPKTLMNLGGHKEKDESKEKKATEEGQDGQDQKDKDVKPEERRTLMFSGRSLTYLIEEGIRCVMNIEDVDSILASLQPQRFEDPIRAFERARLQQQRQQLVLRLAESLDITEFDPTKNPEGQLVLKFAGMVKGRLLIYRALRYLGLPHNHWLVTALLHDASLLALPKQPAPLDTGLAQLICDVLFSLPLPAVSAAVSAFLNGANKDKLQQLTRSRLGCMILRTFLKKGHTTTVQIAQNQQHQPPGQTNPVVAVLTSAFAQWKVLFDQLVTQLQLAGLITDLPKEDDKKPEAKKSVSVQYVVPVPVSERETKAKAKAGGLDKEEKGETPVKLALYHQMWELIAGLVSMASKEQRETISTQLKSLIEAEIAQAKSSNSQPISALSYLAAQLIPPAPASTA